MTTLPVSVREETVEWRARQSLGSSNDAIYEMVADALQARDIRGARLVDVGCGQAALWPRVKDRFTHYCGVDAVRYNGFPDVGEFYQADLDRPDWPVQQEIADAVVSLETIEHLENPWAFVRGLVRIAKPGAWVVVTTPNQLSWLSLLSLIVNRRFVAFTDSCYPVHKTALLESDLVRIAESCGLSDATLGYSLRGRLPTLGMHYPRALARRLPRALSDNLMLIGRKPLD
jgi:2-polyprenyl-3-methyl-5-hydroxy-6-metoxy-1,4-benzoquinol methylase